MLVDVNEKSLLLSNIPITVNSEPLINMGSPIGSTPKNNSSFILLPITATFVSPSISYILKGLPYISKFSSALKNTSFLPSTVISVFVFPLAAIEVFADMVGDIPFTLLIIFNASKSTALSPCFKGVP